MDRLVKLFADTLGVDPVSLSDLSGPENTPKWDSLKAMELVAALEEEFSIELSTREIMSMRTIGLVRSVLEKKGAPV